MSLTLLQGTSCLFGSFCGCNILAAKLFSRYKKQFPLTNSRATLCSLLSTNTLTSTMHLSHLSQKIRFLNARFWYGKKVTSPRKRIKSSSPSSLSLGSTNQTLSCDLGPSPSESQSGSNLPVGATAKEHRDTVDNATLHNPQAHPIKSSQFPIPPQTVSNIKHLSETATIKNASLSSSLKKSACSESSFTSKVFSHVSKSTTESNGLEDPASPYTIGSNIQHKKPSLEVESTASFKLPVNSGKTLGRAPCRRHPSLKLPTFTASSSATTASLPVSALVQDSTLRLSLPISSSQKANKNIIKNPNPPKESYLLSNFNLDEYTAELNSKYQFRNPIKGRSISTRRVGQATLSYNSLCSSTNSSSLTVKGSGHELLMDSKSDIPKSCKGDQILSEDIIFQTEFNKAQSSEKSSYRLQNLTASEIKTTDWEIEQIIECLRFDLEVASVIKSMIPIEELQSMLEERSQDIPLIDKALFEDLKLKSSKLQEKWFSSEIPDRHNEQVTELLKVSWEINDWFDSTDIILKLYSFT